MVRQRAMMAEPAVSDELIASMKAHARPLHCIAGLDPLLTQIGAARFVLIGEASHGTADFYAWRSALTRRLIEEKGFQFVAVEGDWPDCYDVNRFVKGYADSNSDAHSTLLGFERWPTWMWANEEVAAFVDWLRDFNNDLPVLKRIGFYGLDVYSLWESLYQVMGYLRRTHPEALPDARWAFRCFEPFGEEATEYARATAWVPTSCEGDVVRLLRRIRTLAPVHSDDEAHFIAEQNALVVKNAEAYYRAIVRGGPESWNIRDRHMMATLDRLVRRHGPAAKAVVWEHNTHIGDARFTDMAAEGMVNVGQLAREYYAGAGVVLVGFGSYHGRVIASREWGAPFEVMAVPPAREGSWEAVLHEAFDGDRLLLFDDTPADWSTWRGHRAVGVVYRPQYEHRGNYVPTMLPWRYDAFLYLDRTEAVRPLRSRAAADVPEVPDTYPSGV